MQEPKVFLEKVKTVKKFHQLLIKLGEFFDVKFEGEFDEDINKEEWVTKYNADAYKAEGDVVMTLNTLVSGFMSALPPSTYFSEKVTRETLILVKDEVQTFNAELAALVDTKQKSTDAKVSVLSASLKANMIELEEAIDGVKTSTATGFRAIDKKISDLSERISAIKITDSNVEGELQNSMKITTLNTEVESLRSIISDIRKEMKKVAKDGGGMIRSAVSYGGAAAGSDTQVQFNDSGSNAGSSKFVFNKTTGELTLNGKLSLAGGGGFEFTALPTHGKIQTYSSLPLALNPDGNNVGIGINVASYLLHVNAASGTQYIMNSSGAINTFLMSSTVTGRGYVGTLSNHPFTIRTNATDRFTVDATGLVGIGTTAPADKLHVIGDTRFSAPTVTSQLLRIRVQDSQNGVILDSVTTNGNFLFYVNGVEKSRMNASGSWALGSDGSYGPGSRLSVNGNATIGTSYKSIAGPTNGLAIEGLLGLGTTSPTHTLTLSSTSTGIAVYNTADQTTNYERVLARWASNQFIIEQRNGGTGVGRSLLLQASDNADGNPAFINIFSASNVKIDMGVAGSFGGETNLVRIGSGTSLTASTAITQRFLEITGTVNQATSAGYTALLVNPTETTVGNGTKLLADFQVGGTSKLNIDNGGEVIQALGKYFRFNSDTNWRIGGVTATAPFTISAIAGNSLKLVHGSGGTDGIAFGPNGGTSTMEMVGGNVYFRGNIELGAVSDTTISRSSAGVIAVEGVVIPSISSTNTLTNKFITPQVQSVADAGGTLTPVSITNDIVIATALSQATTIAAPTGSPVQGEKLTIRLKDNGTARALTWNAIYRAIGVTLPTTTVISKIVYVGCIYNSTDTKWDVVSVAQEA